MHEGQKAPSDAKYRGILGLDDCVGTLGAADDLEAVLVHYRAETVLPEPELVARLEPLDRASNIVLKESTRESTPSAGRGPSRGSEHPSAPAT